MMVAFTWQHKRLDGTDDINAVDAIRRMHTLLDRSDVPPAFGAVCDDPQCQSNIEHRVGTVLGQLEDAHAEIASLKAEVARLTTVRDEALIVYRALDASYQALGKEWSSAISLLYARVRAMHRTQKIARHWRSVAHGDI